MGATIGNRSAMGFVISGYCSKSSMTRQTDLKLPRVLYLPRAVCRAVLHFPWHLPPIFLLCVLPLVCSRFLVPLRFEPRIRVQVTLAQANRVRSNFEHLVLRHVRDVVLHGHLPRRLQLDRVVGAGSAHVGELLPLGAVHLEVPRFGVLSDHHPFVHFLRHPDKQSPARLDGVEGKRCGASRRHRDEPSLFVGVPRPTRLVHPLVRLENGVHHRTSVRVVSQGRAHPHEEPGRGVKHQPNPLPHLLVLPHAAPQQLHALDHRARVLLVHVDGDLLYWLQLVPRDPVFHGQDPRRAHANLVLFAPHLFDEDPQLQFPSGVHLQLVRVGEALLQDDGDVVFHFLLQPGFNLRAV
mmetsp:Transcript_21274/g.42182  ORF Transcript_21274/g.42182 Transcript_21274/m.42182 type:complete len:352 (+) Transcript_21274:12-1067(+)